MKKKYLVYLILILAILAVLAGWLLALGPLLQSTSAAESTSRAIQVYGQNIRVSVVDTDATRELGLSGRAGLAPDEGMLFVFPTDGKYAFWMKDMKFSIDMVWISADGKIVYMAQNVSPDTYPNAFVPTAPARYVLEVSAGYAMQHSVAVGDTVQL